MEIISRPALLLFVAVIVMDIDFDMIDFNPCRVSAGNPGPSYLAGIDRCKKGTSCKQVSGFGLTRGGYKCKCKSRHHYPKWIKPVYQGVYVEQATEDEYKNGFNCLKTGYLQVHPQIDALDGVTLEGGSTTRTTGGGESKPLTRNAHSRRTRSVNATEEDVYPTNQMHRAFIPPNRKTRKLVSRLPDDKHKTVLRQMVDSPKKETHKRKNKDTWAKYVHGKVKYISRRQIKILRKKWLKVKNVTEHRRQKRAFRGPFDQVAFDSMKRIFRQKTSVTPQNCHTKPKTLLYLPGDVGYGFDNQFEAEGRTALRLAHFVSNFLQNTSPNDNFGILLGGGRLHMEHLFGEVLANVMANHKILSSGIFWDTHQFVNQDDSTREFFGPLAYKKQGSFYVIDSAGLPLRYADEDWYSISKSRWSTNVNTLETYKMRPMVRSNPEGASSVQFEYFPMSYKAPAYKDGFWTRPTFKCDGRVDEWVLTYVVPFFGLDGLRKKIQFKGVVTVDVPLDLLEIDQCPSPFYVANAFKNTARCDQISTSCRKQKGFPFLRGAYRCTCRQGFEFPHKYGKFRFDGSLMELEWEKKEKGLFSRFDQLKCRIAGSETVVIHRMLLILSTGISFAFRYVLTP